MQIFCGTIRCVCNKVQTRFDLLNISCAPHWAMMTIHNTKLSDLSEPWNSHEVHEVTICSLPRVLSVLQNLYGEQPISHITPLLACVFLLYCWARPYSSLAQRDSFPVSLSHFPSQPSSEQRHCSFDSVLPPPRPIYWLRLLAVRQLVAAESALTA